MRQNPFANCLAVPSFAAAISGAPDARSSAYSLDITCPLARLRDFMEDAQQWLPWAMPRLQSVQPLPFGQWLLKTSRSVLKLRLCPTTTQNELLYEVVAPGLGICQTLLRIDATPTGCQLTIMHHKHEKLPLRLFKTSTRHARSGLRTLKLVLEQD